MLRGCTLDLFTVFDAILTSRQTREKLQYLYENLTSNNFRRTCSDSGKCFGFWDVFWILGRVLGSGTCFWILGRVYGF